MNTILSPQEHRQFEEQGFVVVRDAVPIAQCEAVVHDCFKFLELDEADPSTWYPQWRGGNALVHLHQAQSIWDNRQHPRVYEAFREILGEEKLWASMDRAGFKPPITPDQPQHDDRGFIHWDLNLEKLPAQRRVQGVLALRDTTSEMGGFRCVPGFCGREQIQSWLDSLPAEKRRRNPDLSLLPAGFEVVPVEMKAGDLVIWSSLLLHGNGRNEGRKPRLAQYITMHRAPEPGSERAEQDREERILAWRERRAPANWERDIPERLKGREAQLQSEPSELSDLGRKLLGLDPWS